VYVPIATENAVLLLIDVNKRLPPLVMPQWQKPKDAAFGKSQPLICILFLTLFVLQLAADL
jgi:hypothetical protein